MISATVAKSDREIGHERSAASAQALIAGEIARIDRLVSRQVAEIYRSPLMQELEAGWLNLADLAEFARKKKGFGKTIKLKVLNASFAELGNDFGSSEFDEGTALYEKVYSEEFGSPGGEPFAVLIGNYKVTEHYSTESAISDLDILKHMATVCGLAFSPFICAADPSLFELTDFRQLTNRSQYSELFSSKAKIVFNSLRGHPDANFLGLTVPDIVLREPYHSTWWPAKSFVYKRCNVEEPVLMGRSVFSFAKALVHSFAQSHWYNGITGLWVDDRSGGSDQRQGDLDKVASMQRSSIYEQRKPNVTISEDLENRLSRWGFIPLTITRNHTGSYFNTCQSLSRTGENVAGIVSFETRLSMMLQYVLYVSRFAHYIKVLIRDRIGSYQTAADCQFFLENWIADYVIGNDNASSALKTRKPIKEVRISVVDVPDKPGAFSCSVTIQPHFYGANVKTSISIVSEPNLVKVG